MITSPIRTRWFLVATIAWAASCTHTERIPLALTADGTCGEQLWQRITEFRLLVDNDPQAACLPIRDPVFGVEAFQREVAASAAVDTLPGGELRKLTIVGYTTQCPKTEHIVACGTAQFVASQTERLELPISCYDGPAPPQAFASCRP